MESLGDDLILLSIKPANGTIGNPGKIGFGLMGSELVRLAALGRVDIIDGRIAVTDPAPTGDSELDAALASMAGNRQKARAWVGRPRRNILDGYLARLDGAGTLQVTRGRFLGLALRPYCQVTDPGRLAQARARLDEIALSDGPVDAAQAALAGLAGAIDVDRLVYPGWDGSKARKRLAEAGKGATTAVTGVAASTRPAAGLAATDSALAPAVEAAGDAAVEAASQAATHAAVNAAHSAAVHAAVHAANHAAAHAAAQHAAGGGADFGGGHHGH
jgi:hypothetical protein